MQTDFKLYKVDMKYIRNLHNIDDKVLFVSPQAGKDNSVNVLYKKYISNEPFAGRKRCLNFPKLESECKKYNSAKKRGIK